MFSNPVLHCPLSSSSPACKAFVVRRRCRRLGCVRAMAMHEERTGTALLWFKQDLRTDDHPGLAQAALRHRNVVPVYIFDRRILSGYSDEILKLLITALEGLKKSLQDQGSNLLTDFGSVEVLIPKLANEMKATHIFVEEEVEYKLRSMVDIVKASLSALPLPPGGPKFVSWRTPFYHIENLTEMPDSYNEFQKLQPPLTSPLAVPSLPMLELEDQGMLPTLTELKKYLHENPCKLDKTWTSLKKIGAKPSLKEKSLSQAKNSTVQMAGHDCYDGMSNEHFLPSNSSDIRKVKDSLFVSRKGNVIRGGTDVALNALSAYLRYLEGTSRDNWQELHEKLRFSENGSGSSFGALFGYCLYLGILSRRRVHYETIKYEKERNAGFISPFGYSVATVAAAVDTVKSMEWFFLLNVKNQILNNGRFQVRVWRWKGYLIQYTVAGNEGPAVLLVHGFGAFLEHYRDNISSIADEGYRVWAITLLGFGKSEKPSMVYTEFIWAELLRDFIIDVVGEPVHLVGNSIGGFISAVVGGLWSPLIKSLILINPAGSIVPDYSLTEITERDQTSGLARLGARLLLAYLQLQIQRIVENYYPTKPERVDDWLINEMIRASHDPGVHSVLVSIFNFKLSLPLNFLLDSFGGKVLVIQGIKDPLSKSESRLSSLRENCDGVTIIELDAGHCPHDELPESVNTIISKWTNDVC